MGSVWIAMLGLVVAAAVVGRIDLRIQAVTDSIRAAQARTNAATDAAVHAVQRQLAVGPVPVAVRAESGLRGRRLVVDTGTVVLRLHLYGGIDRLHRGAGSDTDQAWRGPAPAFLTRLVDEPGRGWQLQLAGHAGTSSYDGWLLENCDVVHRPAGRPPRRDGEGSAADPTTSRRSTSPWGGAG